MTAPVTIVRVSTLSGSDGIKMTVRANPDLTRACWQLLDPVATAPGTDTRSGSDMRAVTIHSWNEQGL